MKPWVLGYLKGKRHGQDPCLVPCVEEVDAQVRQRAVFSSCENPENKWPWPGIWLQDNLLQMLKCLIELGVEGSTPHTTGILWKLVDWVPPQRWPLVVQYFPWVSVSDCKTLMLVYVLRPGFSHLEKLKAEQRVYLLFYFIFTKNGMMGRELLATVWNIGDFMKNIVCGVHCKTPQMITKKTHANPSPEFKKRLFWWGGCSNYLRGSSLETGIHGQLSGFCSFHDLMIFKKLILQRSLWLLFYCSYPRNSCCLDNKGQS